MGRDYRCRSRQCFRRGSCHRSPRASRRMRIAACQRVGERRKSSSVGGSSLRTGCPDQYSPRIWRHRSSFSDCRFIYLAKVNFVKHDLVRMADAPKPCDETQKRDDGKGNAVVPVALLDVLALHFQAGQRIFELAIEHGGGVFDRSLRSFGIFRSALADLLRLRHAAAIRSGSAAPRWKECVCEEQRRSRRRE
jgi:hypothetical protein